MFHDGTLHDILMQEPEQISHWLRHYASPEYAWKTTCVDKDGKTRYCRPIGLVESIFDSDGRFWEGRADINCLLELDIRSSFAPADLRKHILLAWTCLRCQHLLLQAKAVIAEASSHTVHFAIDLPATPDHAVQDTQKHLVFLADHYDSIDWQDFWRHCQNATRVIDPNEALSKIFVLPPEVEKTSDMGDLFTLRFLAIGAHQIWDGLATGIWMRNLTQYLNEPSAKLETRLAASLQPDGVRARLPPPQEALYPPLTTSLARQRWFWLLTRILRHVRRPLTAGFSNPLYRPKRLQPIPLSPVYDKVLSYSHLPPLNTITINISFPRHHTQILHRLCREAGTSVGAGCFALVALSMMAMYEAQSPTLALEDRKPFITGFPLNPRAFFDHKVEPDSCMLAFSDGISLPFLPSSLPVDCRLRLLALSAQRQLGVYQKRKTVQRASRERDIQFMTSRGAGRVLAIQYLNSVERSDAMLPPQLRQSPNPQGAYPASQNATTQTCGVSSVGRRDPLLRPGLYDVHRPVHQSRDGEEGEVVADFRSMKQCVRAREGEFLVGIGGDEEEFGIGVSVDASLVDLELVEQWRGVILGLLEGVVARKGNGGGEGAKL